MSMTRKQWQLYTKQAQALKRLYEKTNTHGQHQREIEILRRKIAQARHIVQEN